MFLPSADVEQAALAQAAALGFPVPFVLVPHPIQDRTDDGLRALADAAHDAVVAAVTRPSE